MPQPSNAIDKALLIFSISSYVQFFTNSFNAASPTSFGSLVASGYLISTRFCGGSALAICLPIAVSLTIQETQSAACIGTCNKKRDLR